MKKFLRSEIEEMDIYELLNNVDINKDIIYEEREMQDLISEEVYSGDYGTALRYLDVMGESEIYIFDREKEDEPTPIEDMIDLEFYLKRNHYIEIEEDI